MSEAIPSFVYTADLVKQAAATETWVAREARKARHSATGWKFFCVFLGALVLLLGGALNYALPLIRLVPVFFWVDGNGVTRTALTTESLPTDLSDASIKAWLWQYVLHRETYSWTEADYNHQVIDAMSSKHVREEYDKWFDGKNNPHSYLAQYGRFGVVRIELESVNLFEKATPDRPGKVIFQIKRRVYDPAQTRQDQILTIALSYVQGYNEGLNINDIMTFNPSRIVVTDYPGPLPPGALVNTDNERLSP